jgi:hypothetical protein
LVSFICPIELFLKKGIFQTWSKEDVFNGTFVKLCITQESENMKKVGLKKYSRNEIEKFYYSFLGETEICNKRK